MKTSKLKIQNWRLLFCVLHFAFGCVLINAQSTNIEYPTPITAGEINGKIPARDIGDSRLTRYYYVFNANQGDVLIKIEAVNLNGDIDIFYADNLRPLTKISVYADSTSNRIAREIYLRKREKLILRVEGRTPNDDAAIFSVKFEGSFEPFASDSSAEEPEIPVVKSETEGAVRVNSVGTIIETKSEPAPKQIAAETTVPPSETVTVPESVSTQTNSATEEISEQPKVAVTENLPEETTVKIPVKTKTPARRRTRTTQRKPAPPAASAAAKAEELAKALENVQLIILFKDGSKIERPMNEVLRVNVDKGVLTVVAKDGSTGRFPIVNVTKMTIE